VADRTVRGAARAAALIALPAALLAGVVVYQVLAGRAGGAGDGTAERGAGVAPTSARPQSTTPVDVPARPLPDRVAAVCRALAIRLPDRLGDLPRRPVTAGPDQNAAYGDPPVTLACGGPAPSAPPGAQYLEINKVCWYYERGPDGSRWSLAGHEVPVVVMVPAQYTGQYLVDLATPVTAAVARTGRRCG